jgi:RNA polymerase sigma-70 factor (ECF subfamily)
LLQRAADRNQEAWARLVKLYTPLVAYWFRRDGLSEADTDDLVQEVFGAVAASLPQFRAHHRGGPFRGWLRGIARHKLIDHLRSGARQPQAEGGSVAYARLQEVPDASAAEEADPPQEVTALYHRALDLIRGEFEPRTWEAFWRTGVLEQAVADVAADLGMTEVAVRKAKSRVLRRLRDEAGELIA